MNFLELVKTRYSVRSYDSRLIEKEKMDYVMECARMAPSAVNFQPWKFFVINTPEMLTAIKAAYPREWISRLRASSWRVPTIPKVSIAEPIIRIMPI